MALAFQIPWWDHEVPGITEYRARAVMLVNDRAVQHGIQLASIAIVPHGIVITPHAGEYDLTPLENLGEELAKLSELGQAACICGCGADLAIHDCTRRRIRERAGLLEVMSPVEYVVSQIHPTHTKHGILGWIRDPVLPFMVVTCSCGSFLRVARVSEDRVDPAPIVANGGVFDGTPAEDLIKSAYNAMAEDIKGLLLRFIEATDLDPKWKPSTEKPAADKPKKKRSRKAA